jgi:hypothetical protein
VTGRPGRGYRWLLLAYPLWFRRERGLELLTTLLDTAEPGRRRPGAADVADVVRGGLRCRLRMRGGPVARTAGVVLGTLGALLGAAVAPVLACALVAPAPGEAEAVAVAEQAFGVRPVDVPGPVRRCDYYCPDRAERPGDEVIAYDDQVDRNLAEMNYAELMPPGTAPLDDYVSVAYSPDGAPAELVGRARERLAAAGWRVGEIGDETNRAAFWARRDDLTLYVSSGPSAGAGQPTTHLTLSRNFPGLAVAAALAGFTGGALVGWLATARVVRRTRARHPALRALLGLAAVPLIGAAVVVTAMTWAFSWVMLSAPLSWQDVMIPAAALSMIWDAVRGVPGVREALAASVVTVVALATIPTGALPTHPGARA